MDVIVNYKINFNIYIIYNMPTKMNMIISNGNYPQLNLPTMNTSTLASIPASLAKPTTLKSPMISRVNSVKPGCGSCGRK